MPHLIVCVHSLGEEYMALSDSHAGEEGQTPGRGIHLLTESLQQQCRCFNHPGPHH